MRIALIHALRHSPPPVEAAFARLWPEVTLMNLLDDSLSADLAAAGSLTAGMTDRFLALARYAVGTGADGILFTCSAFGPCIEAVAAEYPNLPVLKPNEAMIEEASALGGRLALLATFKPTLTSMPSEFPPGTDLELVHVAGALEALDRGDVAEHDRLIVAAGLQTRCDAIALAQFSMARAQHALHVKSKRPVLATPDSAVRKLRLLIGDQVFSSRQPRGGG